MNSYLYVTADDEPVLIRAKRRPGPNTMTRTGTWVISEMVGASGSMRWCAVGEITLGTIKTRLRFVGRLPEKSF